MGFADGVRAGISLKESRRNAQERAKIRNQELEKQGYQFDEQGNMSVRPYSMGEAEQLAAKEAVQLARDLQNKLLAQTTDTAFEDFAYTGDANYLQKALSSNPELKETWAKQGVQMVSNIDFDRDTNILKQAGLREAQYDTDEKREIMRKNLYKVYDGKNWTVGVANQAAMETGVMKRMGQRRAAPIQENYKAFTSLVQGPKGATHTAEGHKYEKQIMAAAEKYDLPPNLIASQMHVESAGNPNAVSPKGAGGLMQIMPPTAKDLGIDDVFDPNQAIEGGAKYMRQLLDRYNGDVKLALAAYNGGMGNVDKYGGIPPFPETQQYVKKILGNLDVAERYYESDAESVANALQNRYASAESKPSVTDTILEHRRSIANAAAGTSNQNRDKELELETRKVGQKDTDLALEAEAQQIKREELLVKLKTDGKTTKQKDLDAAADKTEQLLQDFGGEEQFFNMDFSDPKQYNKAYRAINEIEVLTNTELSEADKKAVTEIRQLISLGDPASKLSEAQTGLVDKQLAGAKKYLSDNIKGVEAKTAYAAFRNSVRHALYGSALTEAEIKSFNEAYGTDKQKLGPVLEAFKTSLAQVQAKLDSTANLMNPYSAKVRLGADQEKLQGIQEALQQRVDYIQGLVDENGKALPNEQGYTKDDRNIMDELIGAKQ
jgi:soluble lytic murein transglycosylase-like protein